MGRVIVPVPDRVLMQPGSGFALLMEPGSELTVDEPLELLLVTVGRSVEVDGIGTQPIPLGGKVHSLVRACSCRPTTRSAAGCLPYKQGVGVRIPQRP